MYDFFGELRELRDEDLGEPRAVGAFVALEAAGRRDAVRYGGIRVERGVGMAPARRGEDGRQFVKSPAKSEFTLNGGSIERPPWDHRIPVRSRSGP